MSAVSVLEAIGVRVGVPRRAVARGEALPQPVHRVRRRSQRVEVDPERVDEHLERDTLRLGHEHEAPRAVGVRSRYARIEHGPGAVLKGQRNADPTHLDLIGARRGGDQAAGGKGPDRLGDQFRRRLPLDEMDDAADRIDFSEGVSAERHGPGPDELHHGFDQVLGDLDVAQGLHCTHVRSPWLSTGTRRAA